MKAVRTLLLLIAYVASSIACSDKPPESAESVEPDVPHGKVTAFGLFQTRGSGWLADDPASSTGKTIRGATLEFTQETDRVPLRTGVIFGYRYWLKLSPDQNRPDFRRVLVHPEITLPGGSRVSRSERKIAGNATHGIVTAIDAYSLSEDYELVEGEWVFKLYYGDELLTEQKFTTYWP